MTVTSNRREFLKGSVAVGAGLIIGLGSSGSLIAAGSADLVPNPFVKVMADNSVVVIAKHFEMGQGTTTGLATLIAEELDADWDKVVVEWAPADAAKYANLAFQAQGTGGSTAIANSFMQYREAGAAARQMLVDAAAAAWKVPAGEITTENNKLSHKSGKSATYGEMASAAADVKLAAKPKLKEAKDFKLIGKQDLPRKDSKAKTDGTAMFAMDFSLPDMAYAVIARSPRFGGTVKSFDAKDAMKVKGVLDIKPSPRGVIVYAKNSWAAIKGREALKVEWDFSKAENRSSSEVFEEYKSKLKEKGHVARKDGDPDKAMSSAAKTVSAEFEFPYLAHAPMEPLNCIIKFDGKTAEIWDGCQFPSLAQPTAAAVLGIKPEMVKINTLYAGGSFGRRANPTSDYVLEAAMAVKIIGGKWPVKLFYTREDDIRGGYYRPAYIEKIEAGLDKDGNPVAWNHRIIGQSIMSGTPFEPVMVKNGVDSSSVEGGASLPYTIPNLGVDTHNMVSPVTVLWWRSVGHTHTAYSTEIAIDMLAEAAKQDPVEYRLKLLGSHPRHAAVLKLAAEKAGWGKPLPKGHFHGIAVHESFRSFVAQVVEISKNDKGAIKVVKVTCAVDCGVVVNPDIVKAQMEGGIGYALGAAMRNEVTLNKGEVEQSNFPDYETLRINEMPVIDVHIISSAEAPTGVGEPGVPPLAPALANAIHAATGKRAFQLPLTKSGIEFA
ncbi:MAG: molybdopterin cofactor-binding domain-containing protein [Methyloligellaceae bacterium]